MRCNLATIIVSAAAAFMAVPATADIYTYDFSGTVTQVTPRSPFKLIAQVGDPITGMFMYDTTTADTSPDPNYGFYPQSLVDGYSFLLNGQTIVTSTYDLSVTDDNPPSHFFDEMEVFSSQNIVVDGVPQPLANMYVQFRDSTGIICPDDSIPPYTWTENDFDIRVGYILDASTNDKIDFVIDDLVGVPAPGVLALLGVGAAMIRPRRRSA